jgi:K+-sensing histidine kinase KdpD
MERLKFLNLNFDDHNKEHFDLITEMSSLIFNVPLCFISLNKAKNYFEECTIRNNEPFVVLDTLKEKKIISEYPNIRFYAGAPLIIDNITVGTLNIIDNKPRKKFTDNETKILIMMARSITTEISLIKYIKDLDDKKKIIEKDYEFKNLLMGSLTHDIMNTLNYPYVVCSSGNVTLKDCNIIKKNIEIVKNYCENLVDTLKVDSLKFKVKIVETTITEIIRNCVEHDYIKYSYDRDLNLFCDPLLISRVINNLINNSQKYIPEIGGEIVIEIFTINDNILFSVKDNGIGIKIADVCKLFKRFGEDINKKDGTTKRNGIGLYLCKIIVESHKGIIWYDSEYDKGARFVFMIPKLHLTQQAHTPIVKDLDELLD